MKRKSCKLALSVIALVLIGAFAIIKCESIGKNTEDNAVLPSISALPEPTFQDSEYMNSETQNLIFGEWKISELMGFGKIQNDYTNYPDGDNVIGNHIIINKSVFSTKDIVNYKRYQCEIVKPVYQIGFTYTSKENIIYPIDSVKRNSEIDNVIENDSFQSIEIANDTIPFAPVGLLLSSDNHLILQLDCTFYLLEKVK